MAKKNEEPLKTQDLNFKFRIHNLHPQFGTLNWGDFHHFGMNLWQTNSWNKGGVQSLLKWRVSCWVLNQEREMSATWQLMVCLLVVEPIPNETLMKSGILGVSYLELAQHTNWPLTLHNRFEKWTIFWQWNVKRTQFGSPIVYLRSLHNFRATKAISRFHSSIFCLTFIMTFHVELQWWLSWILPLRCGFENSRSDGV